MSKCICDKCGAEFDIVPRRRNDGDIEIVYLTCPHCQEEYLVSVTDSVLREEMDVWRRIVGKARVATDAEISEKLTAEAHAMKEKNIQLCEKLKEEHRNK